MKRPSKLIVHSSVATTALALAVAGLISSCATPEEKRREAIRNAAEETAQTNREEAEAISKARVQAAERREKIRKEAKKELIDSGLTEEQLGAAGQRLEDLGAATSPEAFLIIMSQDHAGLEDRLAELKAKYDALDEEQKEVVRKRFEKARASIERLRQRLDEYKAAAEADKELVEDQLRKADEEAKASVEVAESHIDHATTGSMRAQ